MAGAAIDVRTARSPARVFLIASGVWHLTLSSIGFLANASFDPGSASRPGASGEVFGVFETNGWHNLAGLALGLASLAFGLRPERARFGALTLGTIMIGVWVVLSVRDPATFWLASNGADQVLHALAGFGGVAAGLATRTGLRGASPVATPREGGLA